MQQTCRYGLGVTLSTSFADALRLTKEAFQQQGFGTLAEIDVQKALQEKLGLHREPYTILGMCNPHLASQAIAAEPHIGLLLPCNVLVAQHGERVEVSAQDPREMVEITQNPNLKPIAEEAYRRIVAALTQLDSNSP
ncbi:hypothetical protein CWRG_00094 [Chthonomonas calidirosea]|uniref:Uncharacterized conserved protein n=1 Tax=Chthonomonas calidirosea (strain DSM 23976 / ICMP 18418 / T49) TaxID=1303518 RepID=S0EUD5_CHTCT|nr:DUF302 domain-containing protein [Chthonomonas calidirosea]CCW34884.1 Uncharacterized conserved protein [Chthonomonas calidirosea T49]CEK12572.1 hypothetical protein CWRG_00094 [Chthonomonas calidirosea]CEK12573.1 hypothetical protein CP488_00094 [Chthonomonas calidirosea]CEK13518.1 hypothetical protein CTKA_00097 [Chthonomonas calidirosea]